jgi:hypothetical protein
MSIAAAFTIPLDAAQLSTPVRTPSTGDAPAREGPDAGAMTRHPGRTTESGLTGEPARGLGFAAGLGSRIAGLAPAEEYQSLIRRRQELASKRLEHELTSDEQRALRLVAWHLDRIESAQYQDSLEAWKVAAQGYSKLADEISGLVSALAAPTQKRGPRR